MSRNCAFSDSLIVWYCSVAVSASVSSSLSCTLLPLVAGAASEGVRQARLEADLGIGVIGRVVVRDVVRDRVLLVGHTIDGEVEYADDSVAH
jgi:hypothetical protein